MTDAVRTDALTRRFGSRVAVDAVTLRVAIGEVLGLIGPNGAGKTTLVRVLCGLFDPSDGTATVLGHDVTRGARAIRQRIGYMAQGFSLYRELTVEENLAFYARVYGIRDGHAITQACDRVGIGSRECGSRVEELPTGTRQRVALAAATQHGPDLVFLDEPTSGVDPAGAAAIWGIVDELSRSGVTVVVTTHRLTEAARCGRVALMSDGRLLAAAAPSALVAATRATAVEVEAADWRAAYRRARRTWPRVSLDGRRVRVVVSDTGGAAEAEVRAALRDLPADSVRRVPLTLDDAFVVLLAAAPTPAGT